MGKKLKYNTFTIYTSNLSQIWNIKIVTNDELLKKIQTEETSKDKKKCDDDDEDFDFSNFQFIFDTVSDKENFVKKYKLRH